MDLRAGIVETAAALGMDPVDLATIISYETGGTFSPTQAGPTTQWGQHRGLIQWGEPQADQYGVDWSNPAGSQLGADGAIVRYYRDRGWQPGMGMLDAHSIVNAGAPGRYNASDANNGGAPGTVRDKVQDQMAGHRQRALALLGDQAQLPQQNALAAQGMPQQPQPAPQNALAEQQRPNFGRLDANAFARPVQGYVPQAITFQRRA
jgi:hypothetical protein